MRVAVSRAPGAERVVTPIELFFDLVYVFALGQLSHHLLEHVDLRTGAETTIMALAVVYAWSTTAWGVNWLDPDRLPVRMLLVGLMFASLLMSVAIGDAFDGLAWLFVTGYLLLQVGRSAFLIAALRGRALGEHFVNDLVWELLAGVLWVAGAIADGDARLVLWALAVLATYVGGLAQHWLPGRGQRVDLRYSEVSGGHLVERFRLFFIILLGETVLTMGAAFIGEPFELQRLLALAIGFTGTVALWWCYFQRSEAIRRRRRRDRRGRGRRRLLGHLDADADRARADWHRRRRRARNRPPRRRRDPGLHGPHIRRAGTVPARPGHLHARSGRSRPPLSAAGAGGARNPCGRHRAAHADRRDRCIERRTRRGRNRRHGARARSGAEHFAVAARDQQAAVADGDLGRRVVEACPDA